MPFSSAHKSIDISGKEIDGILLGEIVKLKTKASVGPVLVDANKGVRVELKVRELELEKATAIFPQQVLVEDTTEVKSWIPERITSVTNNDPRNTFV